MKKKGIALFLAIALCFTLLPTISAAEGETPPAPETEGLVLNKTATPVAGSDSEFQIQIEAYSTGNRITTQSTVPCDIVLVLDQSGSMATSMGTTTSGYVAYDKYNSELYQLRMNDNGSNGNLYYKLDTGTYVPVSVTRTQSDYIYVYTYTYTDDNGYEQSFTSRRKSGKPTQTLYGWSDSITQTRLDALISAVNTFVDNVKISAAGADGDISTPEDNVDHRIAIVGFSSNSSTYNNTELLTGVTITESNIPTGYSVSSTKYYPKNKAYNGVQYGSITDDQYRSALQDMSTTAGQTNVSTAVGALTAHGGTMIDDGLNMAYQIFDKNQVPEGTQRQRVVIVFTDGGPGSDGSWDSDCRGEANDAVQTSYNLIHNQGATVYTIGLFSGANGSDPANLPAYSASPQTTDSTGDVNNKNRFLHLVSSNYPDATSMTVTGEVNPTLNGNGYYLSAANSDDLNSIFTQLSQNVGGSSVDLGADTVINDVLADSFELPQNAEVEAKLYKFTGIDNGAYLFEETPSTMSVTPVISEDGRSVSVSGFDYSTYWCGMETAADGTSTVHEGYKVVLTFTVKAKTGFLGGNNVPTNASCGVFAGGDLTKDPVKTAESPIANVPVATPAVTAPDYNVYLLNGVTAEQLQNGVTVTANGQTLDLSKAEDADKPFGLDPWQTAYVDISYAITDSAGNAITDLNNLDADSTYTVSVTVKPKEEATGSIGTPNDMNGKTGTDSGAVNVFKPVVTCKDSETWYGDVAPTDYSANLVSTAWKHNDTDSSAVTMIGDAPAITYTYAPGDGVVEGKIAVKTDISVNVTAKIGDTDITEHVTFTHQDCSDDETIPTYAEFVIHVRTCSLTVTKTGGDESETYVFTVMKDGTAYTSVTITGNNSVTIVELPVGTYSVTEDTGWSWRYTASYSSGVSLNSANSSGTITCTNNKTKDSWLNGFSAVVKNIFGVTSTN